MKIRILYCLLYSMIYSTLYIFGSMLIEKWYTGRKNEKVLTNNIDINMEYKVG